MITAVRTRYSRREADSERYSAPRRPNKALCRGDIKLEGKMPQIPHIRARLERANDARPDQPPDEDDAAFVIEISG